MRTALGAVFGAVLAWAAVAYLARQNQIAAPMLATVRVDPTALAWAALIATVTGMVLGVIPALNMRVANPYERLKDSGPGVSMAGAASVFDRRWSCRRLRWPASFWWGPDCCSAASCGCWTSIWDSAHRTCPP